MEFEMKNAFLSAGFIVLVLGVAGCSTIASSTNVLTDEKIKSQSAGALGYEPSELSIVSRRTEGTNTYVNLKATDKKEFTCVINGGNLLSMGMTNPPMCSKKGESVKTTPFR
jgi:hypothetical protein